MTSECYMAYLVPYGRSGIKRFLVKCANRRVKGVDGDAVFDGNGIKELYKSGAVYVQSIFRVRINNSL